MVKANSSVFQASTDGKAPKRQKHCEIANEDRISMLPGSVMCHILSFLPTKNAVKTSIVSRTWAHTWTSVSNLNFGDTIFRRKKLAGMKSFVKFVNEVLIVLTHPCIKRFKLKLENAYSTSDVNTWICAAITHDVEEFDLSIASEGTFQLPRILFRCGTIEILKLYNGIDLDIIPDSVFLPSLKVIHLKRLQKLCDASIQRLLSVCPILEELLMDIYHFDDLRTLCVQSLSLKTLKIWKTRIHFDSNSKCYRLVVDAPKLQYLNLIDFTSQVWDIHLENLSSIVKATVAVDSFHDNVQMVRFLGQIFSVKILTLSSLVLESLADATICNMPTFYNLIQLVVGCSVKGLLILPKILRCSPNLEVLIFNDKQHCGDMGANEGIFKDQFVAQCFKTSLEMLEFKRFEGNAAEMEIVEYALRNGEVLKKLRILTDYPANSEAADRELVLKKLLMFPRASRACEIEIM